MTDNMAKVREALELDERIIDTAVDIIDRWSPTKEGKAGALALIEAARTKRREALALLAEDKPSVCDSCGDPLGANGHRVYHFCDACAEEGRIAESVPKSNARSLLAELLDAVKDIPMDDSPCARVENIMHRARTHLGIDTDKPRPKLSEVLAEIRRDFGAEFDAIDVDEFMREMRPGYNAQHPKGE